jgi:hypothetical protein
MAEQRSPLKEFRHLDEKLRTVGLSATEHARWEELRDLVEPEAAPPLRPGFDVTAAAADLRASLEPEGRRPLEEPPAVAAPAEEPGAPQVEVVPLPPADAGAQEAPRWAEAHDVQSSAEGSDPSAQLQYDPETQLYYDPSTQWYYDPSTQTWYDPHSQLYYDPSTQAWYDPGAPKAHDAEVGSDDGAAAQATGPSGVPAAEPLPTPIELSATLEAPSADAEPLSLAPLEAPEAFARDFPAPERPAFTEVPPAAAPAVETPPAPALEAQAPEDVLFAEPPPVGGPGSAEPLPSETTEALPVSQDAAEAAPPSALAEAPPLKLATAAEFLSYVTGAQPPTEAEPVELSELEVEELPTVDAEEILEGAPTPGAVAPEPVAAAALEPAPAWKPPVPAEIAAPFAPAAEPPAPPAATAAPLPPPAMPPALDWLPPEVAGVGPTSPPQSFVAGEHRVVVHTVEGQVLRGTLSDVELDAAEVPVASPAGAPASPIPAGRIKAIFFMLPPGEKPPPPEGAKVRVTFRDGRQVAGYSTDYRPEGVGFFMVTADLRTNTGRIWVYRNAVRQVAVT